MDRGPFGIGGTMRLPRRRRWHLRDDEGVSIIEVMVACLVLGVSVLSVAGGLGSGMGLVGHSRQRTAGAGVAQERLERARNVAYEDLALNEDPSHVSTPVGHPDNNVIENGAGPEDDQYQLSDSACAPATPPCVEPLIIDTADGGLRHLDDPFTLAQTDFTVHQFVTWVDDPDSGVAGPHDYKRVIVVVTWKFPVHSGPKHAIVESTFVTDGTIDLPTPSPTATPPLPTDAPSPPVGGDDLGVGGLIGPLVGLLNPPSGGTGACAGDVTRPEIESGQLLSGSGTDLGYLNSNALQFRFKARDPECHPITLFMANKSDKTECTDANGYVEVQQLDGGGDPPAVTVTWTIPAGDGLKAVCAVIQNKATQTSDVWGVNVKLDQTAPTIPGDFREFACSINGSDRVATLEWNASADENFNGYRLYRSAEAAEFLIVGQTTGFSLSDTSLKNYASVRYLVRAYDKAGNESDDSSVISYAKNQC